MSVRGIECRGCGRVVVSASRVQRYCEECSKKSDLKRKGIASPSKLKSANHRSAIAARGLELSEPAAAISRPPPSPNLLWQVRIAVPFEWSASKNHLFALRDQGHVALRRESKSYRRAISTQLKAALRGLAVVQNKVWIDIFVEKPNHRGDAVNFVDVICDAIKDAMPIDDRWFSLRYLDWHIVKTNPRIIIGVGQDSDENVQPCSSCGRILPFGEFHKKKGTLLGIARNCRECSSARTREERRKTTLRAA